MDHTAGMRGIGPGSFFTATIHSLNEQTDSESSWLLMYDPRPQGSLKSLALRTAASRNILRALGLRAGRRPCPLRQTDQPTKRLLPATSTARHC